MTNYGYSDWSTQDFPAGLQEVWFRVRRRGSDYFVEASRDGGDWQQLRLTHLHEERADAVVACGLYACSPNGAGYVAEFSFLTIDAG